jgi:hypothetical protein
LTFPGTAKNETNMYDNYMKMIFSSAIFHMHTSIKTIAVVILAIQPDVTTCKQTNVNEEGIS